MDSNMIKINEASQEFIAWWNIVTDSLSCNTDKDLFLRAWKAWQVKKCTCLTLGGVPPSWLCPIHGEAQRKHDEKYPHKSTLPPNGIRGSRHWD